MALIPKLPKLPLFFARVLDRYCVRTYLLHNRPVSLRPHHSVAMLSRNRVHRHRATTATTLRRVWSIVGRPRQCQTATLPDTLRIAAVSADTKSVSDWLAQGNDVNARSVHGETMLMMAASRGHADMVAALLVGCADVNLRTTKRLGAAGGILVTAVVAAAVAGHTEVVDRLLNAGASVQGLFSALDLARDDGELSGAQHQEIYKHCCECCRQGCSCCSEGQCHCYPG